MRVVPVVSGMSVVPVALVALAACGDDTAAPEPASPSSVATSTAPAPVRTDPPANAIAFRGPFVVRDGAWWVGRRPPGRPEVDLRNGLLAPGPGGVRIRGPLVDGRYRVEVSGREEEPTAPRWCADVVEAPYRHRGDLLLGTAGDSRRLGRLAEGSYRVRLCASGLDGAARTGTKARVLLQLWRAPLEPDAVVATGSRFARVAHQRATR